MSEIKRVHISGLNPTQCSVQDLHSRFESFQLQVSDVHNWPPGKDGVEKVQNWCFLTLKGDAAKIKRATEVLNGTIWKGSKLKIGTAKQEAWKDGAVEKTKAESEDDATAKKKKRRRTKGVESQKVDQPVSIKDVEDGEWGWKKTPAGHLLRPLHLRPSHPLPIPSARPVVETDETEKKARKRKAKGIRPLTRAKRVTVDPSRYGAVHLAGPILDDGTDSLPAGCTWTCQDNEDGGVEWSLLDRYGNVMKQEQVRLLKEKEVQETVMDSEGGSDSEEESSMDEVAAAIDNAGIDTSSDEEEEDLSNTASAQRDLDKSKPALVSTLDEGEESDFSEGYQEVQPGVDKLPKDWQEEKTSHLQLLKTMFGEDGLNVEASLPTQGDLEQAAGTDDEEEIEAATEAVEEAPVTALSAGAQRRAALLGALTSEKSASKSFEPLVRFDPGLGADSNGNVTMDAADDDQSEQTPAANGTVAILEVSREDRVQISSLKDMFRPKEDSAGFSLLGDLDLDLEEDDEEEEAPIVQGIPSQQVAPTYHPAPRAVTVKAGATKLPFIFPTMDANDKSWFSILRKDQSVAPFCRDKTDEEIQEIWKERKGQLTQDYKRRHREALKKKKRKYTGSRAAGTSMPLRS